MFDDWGYGIVAESQPQATRRKSIVQRIVQTHDLPVIDYSALRVRRNSLPKSQSPSKIPLEYPLTRREKYDYWNPNVFITRQPRVSLPEPTLSGDLAVSYLNDLKQEATDLAASLDTTQHQLDILTQSLELLSTKSIQALDHQRELDTLHSEMGKALEVYDKLEQATRSLNSPGTRIITSSTFPQLLKNLAEGLEFCRIHPDFKDMDLYELRHQQCISRANAMVLDHCTSVWRSVQSAIAPKLVPGASQVTVEALLWPKFKADTAKLQPIIANSKGQVLLELQQAYSRIRTQLLASTVQRTLAPTFSQTLSQLKDIFAHEKQLWIDTFGSDDGFHDFSLVFSEPMYIELRGQIVHETSVENLCNIIVLLQDDDLPVSKQILKDSQNRLLFRADQIIDQAFTVKITPKLLRSKNFVYVHETLTLLSQLYEVMTQTVFEQFAHQSIRNCMLALRNTNAVELLGPIEGNLFHIRQIVSLQHGILEYDLGQITQPHIDFSGLGSLLDTVRTTPRTLLSFDKFVDSMPQVVDQLSDSLQELHGELQVVVQQFTTTCVEELLAAVSKNDPATAQQDTQVLRKLAPKTLERIMTLSNQHIADAKIVEALMDSVMDSFVESYNDYYNLVYHAGSPDQLQGVLDPEAFVSWLAHTREEASRKKGNGEDDD